MNTKMKKILITLFFSVSLWIGNSLSNVNMYEVFIPQLDPLRIIKKFPEQTIDFVQTINRGQPLSATVVSRNEDERDLHSYLNKNYIERYSNIDIGLLEASISANPYSSFSANITGKSSQSVCFLSYTSSAKYLDNDEWGNIEDKNPASYPIFIISGLHEKEHCLMPEWAIIQANKKLEEAGIYTTPAAISESMADVIALSLLTNDPLDQKMTSALVNYRNITRNDHRNDGYDKNLTMIDIYLNDRTVIHNSLSGRVVFLRDFINRTEISWK